MDCCVFLPQSAICKLSLLRELLCPCLFIVSLSIKNIIRQILNLQETLSALDNPESKSNDQHDSKYNNSKVHVPNGWVWRSREKEEYSGDDSVDDGNNVERWSKSSKTKFSSRR